MAGYVVAVVLLQTPEGVRIDLPNPVNGAQQPVILEIGDNLDPSCRHTDDGLTVVRLDARAIDELALPTLGNRYVIVGSNSGNQQRQLTEDDIAPGFRITQFNVAGTGYAAIVRRGDTVSAVNSAQYFTSAPSSASIQNSYGGSDSGNDTLGGTWTIEAPFNAASMVGSVKRSGTNMGADPTWTITLTAIGATTQTAAAVVLFTSDIYWGMADDIPTTSEGVQALQFSALSPNVEREVTLTGTNKYFIYAHPAALNAPNYRFRSSQLGIAMDTSAVSVSRNSVSRAYAVHASHVKMSLSGHVVEVF